MRNGHLLESYVTRIIHHEEKVAVGRLKILFVLQLLWITAFEQDLILSEGGPVCVSPGLRVEAKY